MSIPDHFAIVQAVNAAHPHLLQKNDHDSVREFYWRAAWALHQHDPNWGMLTKSAAEAHQVIEGLLVSEDAVAYKGQVPIVDIIGGANNAPHPGRAQWSVDERRRESNLWVQPPPFPDPEPPPTPPRDFERRLAELERRTLKDGDRVSLRTDSGQHYICAESGGGGEVTATRTGPGAWETFTIQKTR